MPKIFKQNSLVILLAALAFFMIGWLWYGVLFEEQWLKLTGMDNTETTEGMGRALAIGFVIALLQALGLAAILSLKDRVSLMSGLKVSALAWLFFALPISAYAWNYAGAALGLLKIDAGHLLAGYLVMGAVYGLLGKRG